MPYVHIKVDENGLLRAAGELQEQARMLQLLAYRIQEIRMGLSFEVKQKEQINQHLLALSDSLLADAQSLSQFASCLEQVAQRYMACEQRLASLEQGPAGL